MTDTLTVTALKKGAYSLRPLQVPPAPQAFRSAVSGKCLLLQIDVDNNGFATAKVLNTGGVPSFLVNQAQRDATKKLWIPAIDANDKPTSDTVVRRYCWPQ